MNTAHLQPRVPTRAVIGSLAALWACYFVLATMRGLLVGYDFGWAIISRRLTICVLSGMIMLALWPFLQMLERRSTVMRLAMVVIGALPLSLGLAIINDTIFADMESRMAESYTNSSEVEVSNKVRITRDEAGGFLVDLPDSLPTLPNMPGPEATSAPQRPDISIHIGKRAESLGILKLVSFADTAFGRYFLVLTWAAIYFALAKAEEARAAERREGEYRRAAAASELRSLRYQVNPHFLFNTLNSLSALVMVGRQDDAETMIQSLSSFYRHTLSGDPTGDLRLMDEIDLQKLYLKIESVRFPNRLRFNIAVDDDVADAMVPGMILQPLVENSVKYAVAATPNPVTISIYARRERGMLELTVSDDGPGKPTGPVQLVTKGCGIGLGNVRDRLRARYGHVARFTHGTRPEGGYSAVLLLPLERDGPAFDGEGAAVQGRHNG